jgi:hypothetical protein
MLCSSQETLIERVIQGSIGGRFVFAPNLWLKGGKGTRQPADLVWIGEECVLLIYMKAVSDRKTKADTEFKRESTIAGNIRQAKGSLRMWRGGRSIVGKNSFTSHELPYDPKTHVIVLSIVDGADPAARYLYHEARELGVTMCATFPQCAFEFLMGNHASWLDIVMILVRLWESRRSIAQSEVLSDLATDLQAIAQIADPPGSFLSRPAGTAAHALWQTLRGLREPGPTPIASGDGTASTARLLNDMLMQDSLKLFCALCRTREKVATDWRQVGRMLVKLLHYQVGIIICDHVNLVRDAQRIVTEMHRDLPGLAFVLIWFRAWEGIEMAIITECQQDVQRHAKMILDQFALRATAPT